MTTSTIRNNRRLPRRRGFTLVEVIISTTLGAFVMAGVMSSFLFLTRSSAAIVGYNRLETEARRGIEEFAQDLRMASDVTWNSNASITLTIPDNYTSTSNKVTYAYDSSSSGPTAKSFYRLPGTSTSTQPKTVLTRDVGTFGYTAFDRIDNQLSTPSATPSAIKRVQLSMTLRKQQQTTVDQTNVVVSASFILRNKPTS